MKCYVCIEVSFLFIVFCVYLTILQEVVSESEFAHGHGDSSHTDTGADIVNDNHNVIGRDKNAGNSEASGSTSGQSLDKESIASPVDTYRKLFRHQRAGHRSAVKRIFALDKYEKQYNLLEMIYTRLFRIMEESKVTLTENGFLPGDSFPTSNTTRDAFSIVLENTAFFCDLLLRLPDMSHRILQRKHEWDIAIRWAISFSNQTQIYEDSEAKLLHLAAQQLNIIEKEPNFVNPFTEEYKAKQMAAEQAAIAKKHEKKAKKKKKKGPRLSSIGHGEL